MIGHTWQTFFPARTTARAGLMLVGGDPANLAGIRGRLYIRAGNTLPREELQDVDFAALARALVQDAAVEADREAAQVAAARAEADRYWSRP